MDIENQSDFIQPSASPPTPADSEEDAPVLATVRGEEGTLAEGERTQNASSTRTAVRTSAKSDLMVAGEPGGPRAEAEAGQARDSSPGCECNSRLLGLAAG